MELLARAEAAGDEEGVEVGTVVERVVRQDGEADLRLDRAGGVADQERVELGVEAAGDGEDAVRRGEVDRLGVLEDVDAKPNTRLCGLLLTEWTGQRERAAWRATRVRLAQVSEQ